MCYTEKIDKVFLVRFAGEALQNLSYYYPEKNSQMMNVFLIRLLYINILT